MIAHLVIIGDKVINTEDILHELRHRLHFMGRLIHDTYFFDQDNEIWIISLIISFILGY